MPLPVDPPILLPVTPDDALLSAATFLHRGVRPDGTHEDGSEWEINSHQWGLFISWAYHRGAALPATLAPDREGGREHDLRFDAPNNRWLKFTRPFSAGYTVDREGDRLVRRPATPSAYLRRWRLANRLFGDDARLVGLSCLGRTQRLVISQPHRAGGAPTWEEIDRALWEAHGLQPIPAGLLPADDLERRAYRRGRLAVFDVCPENAVRAADGGVAFFDVLPKVFSHPDAAGLDRLTQTRNPAT